MGKKVPYFGVWKHRNAVLFHVNIDTAQKGRAVSLFRCFRDKKNTARKNETVFFHVKMSFHIMISVDKHFKAYTVIRLASLCGKRVGGAGHAVDLLIGG